MRPAGDLEQPADVKMLTRLRHDRLVCRNDEHHDVDAADPGEHVLDEPLVARHVDEGQRDVIRPAHVHVQVGEAEVDRDAALLLFLEAIRIGPGQRADEGALPMVDVPGRTDDDRGHGRQRRLRAARSFFPGRCLPFVARVAFPRS